MSLSITVDEATIAEACFGTDLNTRMILYWFCREAEDEEEIAGILTEAGIDATPATELAALLWRLFKDGALG
jgi:hypothetical protein